MVQNDRSKKDSPDWSSSVKEFHKSSFCNGGSCVIVATEKDGHVLVRDSKNTNRETLCFTHSEWTEFVKGVKNNEFDVT